MKLDAAPLQQRYRQAFFSLVAPHVKHVYHFVRHQLRYHEAIGDLRPDELKADEVVDAVLLRAYREFVRAPRRRSLRRWLIDLARDEVAAEVKELKSWDARTSVRTEADVPETPPAEWVSTLGEEILDFHEPDEDLKVEDVIPDLDVPTPEDETEVRELQWCVDEALAGLPSEWREVVLLHHVEGRAGPELARAAGKPEPEVERILERARDYLRQRLVESGCRLKAEDGR